MLYCLLFLQGVGHDLLMLMGPSAVCEHYGHFRSSELSRFRHSKRKYRRCPLCGYCNQITTGNCCSNTLLLVEYNNIPVEMENIHTTPSPGGHGRGNPGGHYTGRCLCCPTGCPEPSNWKPSSQHGTYCGGFPNPFYPRHGENLPPNHQNYAIVSFEHIEGYVPGANFVIGQQVHVRKQEVYIEPVVPADASSSSAVKPPEVSLFADNEIASTNGMSHMRMGPTSAVLWKDGVHGGWASVRAWRNCGGKNSSTSWHGSRVLSNIPWTVEEEDASILLLTEDGSTGLDLSFATHIFLLDPIRDPALRNQIVSRAHRMGATGPVQVQLVQVISEEDEYNENNHHHHH